jgi:hypothetical protein
VEIDSTVLEMPSRRLADLMALLSTFMQHFVANMPKKKEMNKNLSL